MIINMNHSDSTIKTDAIGMFNSLSSLESLESKDSSMDYLETTVIDGQMAEFNDTLKSNDTFRLDPVLIERFTRNRSIDSPWFHILILMYCVLIIFGSLGNMLVVVAVLRKPMMRTARNLFILNLAISDLLLCLVTMPLTLMEILSKYWPFGSCAVLCKMIAMLQALSIFVSTISITAIAFDRYQVIVYPTRDSLQIVGAVSILAGIWLLALLLASPLFIYKSLVHADIPPVLQALGIHHVSFCIEDWPMNHGRFYYSMFSLCVQYLVPILIVSGAYFGIYNKLKNRITVVTVQTTSTQRNIERGRRMKRTNCLLISIAIIFGVSWLPLNFFNLYADMKRPAVTNDMLVMYAFCHMIGMSSACSNPLLYGWLNDNFRKEFKEILCRSKENTNIALNGHTTGGAQSRRKRKHNDISKGDLKLLSSVGFGQNGDAGRLGTSNNNTTTNGLRSAVTESVALTENPMSTEVTTLVMR
ncbi:neuropeptide F receptor-like isoform X1 [Lucilia sericata]|uniref:neuropeptide F receptor-like isoform X1 n=2 Tax=Lucilia sericata TaxID=13632 RepID=UPI0018A7FC6B|nr:neuropeptide F receptor-like isoform X1 [Lucilia sericata]XP_037811237.1 neuropeptide F receptor-like isoform X1 [Lucilia sericata]